MKKLIALVILSIATVMATGQCIETAVCPYDGQQAELENGTEHQVCQGSSCWYVATYMCPNSHQFQKRCN